MQMSFLRKWRFKMFGIYYGYDNCYNDIDCYIYNKKRKTRQYDTKHAQKVKRDNFNKKKRAKQARKKNR